MEGYDRLFMSVNIDTGDRFPQWSIQETREFLMIRAELDPTFMETKRNKLLWEVISTKMKEKGYNRSAEQCKCKWKNLVTRYKGCQTMELEPEGMRQHFPFYNDLQAIFAARMQRMLWTETEGRSKDDEDDKEESDGAEEKISSKKKRRKVIKSGFNQGISSASSENLKILKEFLEEFMKQQMKMEMQWIKAYEEREEKRRMREMEWKQTMDALENERVMMDRRWREREEQRSLREEARAEKRDALVTVLLNKLRREDM